MRTRRTPRQRRLLNGLTQLFQRSHEGAFEHWAPQAHGPAAHATYAHTRPTRPQWPNCQLVGGYAHPEAMIASYASWAVLSAHRRAGPATSACLDVRSKLLYTQASRGTSMASETRAGDACKARQGALGRAEPHLAAFHQPLLEQQVTLCRLAAGAARRSAAAACTEWCLRTTRPAAPEGRASSSPGRAPKERPPDRAGHRREAREAMPSVPNANAFPKKR